MRQAFPAATRKASLWGAFFVCAVFSLAPLRALAEGCRAPGPLREAQVARVVDGDTLRLSDGRSVRLIGVNAPEMGREGRPDEPFAVAATRQLEQLVAASGGRVALLVGAQAHDHYGRSLAHAFGRDGANWEAQQLAAGLGFAVALAPNTALASCQFAAEAKARATGRGLWRRNPVLDAAQLRRGGFALLRGRVEAVERSRGGVWLELEGDLVLQIAPQALAQFDEQALQGLRGQVVEARGWVVDRQRRGALKPGQARWLLRVTHPAMLGR
ncbi:thermonuclease family protein [Pseudomonas sp. GCM10022188]|uniref:thermonuclease family protein n=1 Tax=Pseudomonas TaxID=286 RepID=UPI001E61BF05|nr:thermonuclease family protein [Pseudomonas oryzagri]MCC6076356.1 thermonuclease family protein [Pseudomonas oryzagri]